MICSYTVMDDITQKFIQRPMLQVQRNVFIDSSQTYFLNVFSKWVRVMVFNATFNNISVISWRSVLLVEETGVPGENRRPATIHWQTVSCDVVSSTPRLNVIRTILVVICTDCIRSNYKFSYHTIRTFTASSVKVLCTFVFVYKTNVKLLNFNKYYSF